MRTCFECGTPLGDDYLAGICPCCLVSASQAAGVQRESSDQPNGSEGGAAEVFSARGDFRERYEFLDQEPFSRGGQGEVLRVRDTRLRRLVALKRLSNTFRGSRPAESRFLAEAQIASQLDHPGFLPIFDLGLDPAGRPFYTTALLSGRTFSDVIRDVHAPDRKCALPLRRALEIVHQICNIVAYAHSRRVIHRDLKPTNVLIGEYNEVFVIDLGSACVEPNSADAVSPSPRSSKHEKIETDRAETLVSDPISPLATGIAGVPGTPVFTPPELLQSRPERIGPAIDIYAVGVMLYELCAGRLPYSNLDGTYPGHCELRQIILQGPPTPVRQLNPSIHRDLAAICEKAMARDPARRYATMTELAEDIRAFLETRVVQARGPGRVASFQKWALRNSRQLAMAAIVFAVVGISASSAFSFKIQNDSARQINHLRDAQIAARNGQWRAVLSQLEKAEKAGYANSIDLSLQRIEAWIILAEHQLARAELHKLQTSGDLGAQHGAVLLRLGEHELFDATTAASGLVHVRQALQVGLDRADEAFARGLLAESTPEALNHFHRALELNPYHHAAHRHSLGFEFLLGRFEEFDSHTTVFKALYPEDPSASFLQIARLALDGRAVDAEKLLDSVRNSVNTQAWQLLKSALELMRDAPKFFDLEALFQSNQPGPPQISGFLKNALTFYLANNQVSNSFQLRLPQLPSVKNGIAPGFRALMQIALPFVGKAPAAVEQIKAACRSHPEALFPYTAAMLLDSARPKEPENLRPFLTRQADLFQMATEMPSVIRTTRRMARFMSAVTQLDLARVQPPEPGARQNCLANLRWFLTSDGITAKEHQACLNMAFELRDFDLAREFLGRWESQQPGDNALPRYRIVIELASGAHGQGLRLIDEFLANDPQNPWALATRREAIQRIEELVNSAGLTIQREK